MAMTCRAPRDVDITYSTTSTSVGPGSYNISQIHKKRIIPNAVAFISSENRNLNDNKGTNACTPGPGSYERDSQWTSRKGREPTSGFKDTAPRFKEPEISTSMSGPGVYDVKQSWVRKKKGQQTTRTSRYNRVPMQTHANIPTIPRPSHGYGYEDIDGRIVAVREDASSSSSDPGGPGYYNPNYDSQFSSRRAFVDLNKNQAPRNVFVPSENPGPGYYDPSAQEGIGDRPHNKTSAIFASKVPNCAEWSDKEKLDTPGPGTYTIDKGLANTIAKNVGKTAACYVSFGSESERKGWGNNMEAPYSKPSSFYTPGPGSYNRKGHTFSDISPARRKLNPPKIPDQFGFNSSGQRGSLIEKQQTLQPGPGYYETDHETTSLKGKMSKVAMPGRKGVFGTTTNKFFNSVFYDAVKNSSLPGPGQYEVSDPANAWRGRKEVTSVFMSDTNRFAHTANSEESYRDSRADIAPNSDIFGNEEIVQRPKFDGEVQPRHVAQDNAPSLRPFSSTAPSRFRNLSISSNGSTPGPGSYDSLSGIEWANKRPTTGCQVSFVSTASRFKSMQMAVSSLGPGSYEAPNYLVKKTFNVSVAGPNLHRKIKKRRHSTKLPVEIVGHHAKI